jgi:hypothetical protein
MHYSINIVFILSLFLSSITSIKAETLPKPIRAEYFACKFDDGKDFDDLNKWIGKWNKWMNDSELSGYQGNILTPLYRSPNDHHDFVWVGITDNAETMFNERSEYIKSGLQASWPAKSCPAAFTARQYLFENPKDWQMNYDEFVAIFRDCNMQDDKSFEDVYSARQKNLTELRAHEFNHHSRIVIPGAGVPAGIGAYDFMMLSAHASLKDWGINSDKVESFRDTLTTTSDVYSCGKPRAFVGKRIRQRN